uniref:CCHC-type domain-containing protein n=1 Tax=Tanacetum cinerariifolium TaxID=118510 RepID=A0A699HHK5_TANCI|nr:hypothetical protein [Tanacetum cinerariifolium]
MVQRPKLYTKVKSDFGQPSSGLPFRPPFSKRNELVDYPIVTYTFVYTDSEPGRVFWGANEELSNREPIYPEYIPLEDEHILLAEEQPLPPVVSPTAESPEYVAESNPKEDPEEYEDDETEDGLVDYPIDGRDDGDDDDGDSSGDDADDKDDEEEEHLAPADSTVVISTDELVSPPDGTKPVEVERLLAMPTPSASPLTLLSPPSAGERLARCTALATLPSPPLPPPLHMPPPIDRRDNIPETKMPPRKRLCLSTLGSRDTWVDPAEAVPKIAPMTMGEVNTRVIELAELHEHDRQDLYALLKDAQDSRTRISQRVVVDSQLFVADETKKIDKYVSGLPDNIYGSVKASKPKTLDETIKSSGNANIANAQRNNGANPKGNGCFECGATRHFKRDCPKLKSKDGEKVNALG